MMTNALSHERMTPLNTILNVSWKLKENAKIKNEAPDL
jgi:hypothetical protein